MALMSLRSAALLCGRPRSTLYRAVRRGALPRDAAGRVDTDDLLRLGYLSHSQAEAADRPRSPPPTLHTRMLEYFARFDALLADLQRLLDDLRAHRTQTPPQARPQAKKKRPPPAPH